MELRNLHTFLQIAESGSFTKAAEILGYTQSTVSFQIKQLEEELGCSLFDRFNHSITLTDRGQLLLQHALKIDHSIQELSESFEASDEPAGIVRMYSSDSICEKMMILNYDDFYSHYPNIQLVFLTGKTNDMLRALDSHEVDVIFTLDSHVSMPEYVIAKESPVQLHFMTNPASPLAGQKDIPIEEVLKYPLLLTEKGMSYREILDRELAERGLVAAPILETGRTDILTRFAEHRNNITFLPDFVAEAQVASGSLVCLDVKDFNLTIWKQLIYHRDKWISRHMKAFLDYVMSHEFEW